MMIKRSLRLIFVLMYKSTYLPRNVPVIRENGDYFTVALGLFKLLV